MNTLRRMTNRFRLLSVVLMLLLVAGCNMRDDSSSSIDLFATLQASTPLTGPTPDLLETPNPTSIVVGVDPATITPTSLPTDGVPAPSPADDLTGHIVFTCQIFKVQAQNQICIMNADGTGFRRLTTNDSKQHFYPSLAPDGQSVVYSAFVETDNYDIFELYLANGNVTHLTNTYGVETGPEISPDGGSITYARYSSTSDNFQIYLANRNGKNAGNIARVFGWDPTWSPNGKRILFASDMRGSNQLYTVKLDGSDLQVITNLPALRGRSDWSADGNYIVTYSGPAWNRELYIMNSDGTNSHQLTPSGGNSQGPSFSPDGKWVAFTAYFDDYGDDHGCEIYVIRVDGTDLRRLTNNDYCDYQPRWGP